MKTFKQMGKWHDKHLVGSEFGWTLGDHPSDEEFKKWWWKNREMCQRIGIPLNPELYYGNPVYKNLGAPAREIISESTIKMFPNVYTEEFFNNN